MTCTTMYIILVGECMAFLASGSKHTVTVSARAIQHPVWYCVYYCVCTVSKSESDQILLG